MLETNSPDWTRLRRLHHYTTDLPTGLQEVTERLGTLSGLDGDPAPHGRMLAALRDPRLTRCRSDLGWNRMEDSLALLPHRSPWDSEVFMVPCALVITLEMGGRGNLGIFVEVDFTQGIVGNLRVCLDLITNMLHTAQSFFQNRIENAVVCNSKC